MGASLEPEGRPGKRSLSADLNLVPYIDLLTCMVAFLLITAVWTQLAQLKTSARRPGEGEEAPPLTKLAVVVGEDAMNLVVGQEREMVPSRAGEPDWSALATLLQRTKARYPDRTDMTIASDDGVLFDRLTMVMDTAIASGFPSVSLETSHDSGL
jgi:biopolymer transport protein TolR